ncbi:hypothetical protein AMAG_06548 [Allomyces macrogynus ATCC 38327]|uniref:Phosphoinositide phospholipase C n=1 Tax=Allomyces macrogynus (strain ATCC 38327) TaxID=578462 RepID=A0A0L0SGV8_ALLM3|nr:hypothetical protein AMAG_06548 [Allomyces macrogynus ATCC 38327]|eukprot:KNE61748.1 hypothetical protein AMAG_06548 [Allomyces macrogynus ATCC 38327]
MSGTSPPDTPGSLASSLASMAATLAPASSITSSSSSSSSSSAPSQDHHHHPDLLALAVYLRTAKFGTASDFCTMSSLAESAAVKHVKSDPLGLVASTRRHMARVYPGGRRVGSSNVVPFALWAAGVQMVALNWQTFDRGMDLNTAFFQLNARAGYVLKPDYLLDAAVAPPPPVMLTVHILSGHHLPKPRGKQKGDVIDPHVLAEIWDAPPTAPASALDDAAFTYRTSRVLENGWNPSWNEMFATRVLSPALAMVRLAVYDHDDLVGSWTAPVAALRPGFRFVYLRNWKGKSDPLGLVASTRRHMARVYPGGRRVGSSNVVPFALWAAGVQMVALNWQTFDRGMDLNTAFFQLNARAGYVLKPDYLLDAAVAPPRPVMLTGH